MTYLNLYPSIKDIGKEKRNFWYDRCQPVFLHSQNLGVPGNRNKVDLVAQLVEHITFNDGALGPSPSGITEK